MSIIPRYIDGTYCQECGGRLFRDTDGVLHHGTRRDPSLADDIDHQPVAEDEGEEHMKRRSPLIAPLVDPGMPDSIIAARRRMVAVIIFMSAALGCVAGEVILRLFMVMVK